MNNGGMKDFFLESHGKQHGGRKQIKPLRAQRST